MKPCGNTSNFQSNISPFFIVIFTCISIQFDIFHKILMKPWGNTSNFQSKIIPFFHSDFLHVFPYNLIQNQTFYNPATSNFLQPQLHLRPLQNKDYNEILSIFGFDCKNTFTPKVEIFHWHHNLSCRSRHSEQRLKL